MSFNKQPVKIDINEYAIADIVFITNGMKPSIDIIKKDCLVVRKTDHYNLYKDVQTDIYHDVFDGTFGSVHSWNTKYLIKNKLVDYYQKLVSTKITDEEAIKLFNNIGRSLSDQPNNAEEVVSTGYISKIKKLVIKEVN